MKTPSTDPALWTTRPVFGIAGGPVEVVLTDEGMARAFSVGAQVRRGAAAEALKALSCMPNGRGPIGERHGAKIVPTDLARFSGIEWGYLKSLGYVESYDLSVQLTAAGAAAVDRGHAEQASLLGRCKRAAAALTDAPPCDSPPGSGPAGFAA